MSPHEVMYGTPLRIQLDRWIPLHDSGDYVEAQEYAERMAGHNTQLWSKVQASIEKSQGKMKQQYDRGRTKSSIEVGDWVMVDKKPRGDALSPLFEGHWRVEKKIGVNVHLMHVELGTRKVLHVNRCKRIPRSQRESVPVTTVLFPDTAKGEMELKADASKDRMPVQTDEGEEESREAITPRLRRSTRKKRRPYWISDYVTPGTPLGQDAEPMTGESDVNEAS